MSKYIIVRKYHKPLFLGGDRVCKHSIFCHTKTKLNEPYWSLDTSRQKQEQCAVSKENLPKLLKMAQNFIRENAKYPTRPGKEGKVFVLKLNSPKAVNLD